MTHIQKKGRTLLLMAATVIILATGCAKSELKLPFIISDGMVLQHGSNVALWGEAVSGSTVTVETSWGASQKTETHTNRTWEVKIPAGEPGGPYEITIKNADSTHIIKDVYIGEVWLASGQSNMEMPVAGWPPNDTIQQSAQTIAGAALPAIRMFTVPRNISTEPLDDAEAQWKVCSPQTVSQFSATAFYFARRLNAELGVPVGIIHSSWGGTNAESWISSKTLSRMAGFEAVVENLKSAKVQTNIYDLWLQQFTVKDVAPTDENPDPVKGIDILDAHYSNPELTVDNWDSMILPNNFEKSIGAFDGAVWFRKTVDIPASWQGKNLTLSLGAIDDRDVTWFNGEKVGAMEEADRWTLERQYQIPAQLVKQGKNIIAVRVIDTQGGGGICGNASSMKIYPESNTSLAVSLASEWHYSVAAEYKDHKFYIFNPEERSFALRPTKAMEINANTPTVLYCGMLSPIVNYTVKGAIWYQGEANVGRSTQYLQLMKALVGDWRQNFRNEAMPFYFVQIAPFNYGNPGTETSAWIREAQRRTLQLPNTGMAVTLDIGNVNNIHPANKKDVGDRLAFCALANSYNRDIAFSGPAYSGKFELNGNKITVELNSSNGMYINSSVPTQFEVAGENGIYHPATATVSGNTITLSSPKVPRPLNARYAFRNGSKASLFNNTGLPASTFTTEENLGD